MFYWVVNLSIDKACTIKNFEEAIFNDFKWLVKTYNLPQKTCKPLNNTFPGSLWSAIVMWTEQSEFCDMV